METLDQKPQQQTKTGKDGREVVLSVEGVTVGFNGRNVLEDLNLDVYRGEILGFIGPSGAGKSVLMRTVLRLLPRQAGTISILGSDYDKAGEDERMRLDQRLGVLFQQGALFSGLTVKENIQLPMREYLDLPKKLMDELAYLKIEIPVRTVRRHDQACCPCPGAVARSRPRLPR